MTEPSSQNSDLAKIGSRRLPIKPTLNRGIIIALWMPTRNGGELDRPALAQHLTWLKSKGVDGILALGTTGEFPRMNLAQRERMLAQTIELASPLPVIANISAISLEEVVALGRAARKMGVAGTALLPPWFFPLSQDDMLEFFLRAAEGLDLPFYLYNFPEMTGNRIGAKVISEFAQRTPLAGFKQSGGELSYHADLIALGRQFGFGIFTGADPQLAQLLEDGVAGCVSGYGNFAPEYLVSVFAAHVAKRPQDAAEAAARLRRVGELAGALPVPLNVRSGVEARGINPGDWKTVHAASTLRSYQDGVAAFRQAFAAWGLQPFVAG
jgi:dihydrodipicolinate synthase/N-acetylneuraminate lyase